MPPPPQPLLEFPPLEGANEARRVEGRQGGRSKRPSRVLWDAVLRPPASASRWQRWRCLFSAILYELQPLRCSDALDLSRSVTTSTGSTLQSFVNQAQHLPRYTIALWSFLREHVTLRHIGILVVCIGYYWIVRYLHEWLEAGPMVLIITAMVGIFTVGLRDDNDGQGLSAYSVFNRGFQRIMGTVDAEELMQQHVGAAGGGLMAFAMAPNVQHQVGNDEHDNRHHERQPLARRREAAQEEFDEPPQQPREVPERGGARKSGKKARRQNLDQRREMRRQREAAMALGFGDGNDELQEILAMQRLAEEDDARLNQAD